MNKKTSNCVEMLAEPRGLRHCLAGLGKHLRVRSFLKRGIQGLVAEGGVPSVYHSNATVVCS